MCAGISAILTTEHSQTVTTAILVGGAIEDRTYRIGELDAANKSAVSVAPNQTLEQAVTQMLGNGFSQLPVMQGDRDVKGVITGKASVLVCRLEKPAKRHREFMTSLQIISFDKSIFDAIEIIARHQYVLVQGADKRISGIMTSADLSRQLQLLTEPFLLLSEIEQHIRKLIVGKFTSDELQNACDPGDSERNLKGSRFDDGRIYSAFGKP